MNVIIICSDTFRIDHLGFLKKQEVLTPHLDQLAQESAFFSDFWLCSFPTLVNRIEVFSGRYAFPFFDWGPQPYQYPVLAEVFQHHDFTTALFADNPHLMKGGYRFGRGFDVVHKTPGQTYDSFQPTSTPMIDLSCPESKLEAQGHRLQQYRRNACWYRQHGTNTTEPLFRSALKWLQTPPQRFFLWIDAFDPHQPWDAPEKFQKLYPLNPKGDAVFWPKPGLASLYSQADIENMRSLYKAEVTQIDACVGNLLAHLRETKLLETTAILFCSDHGLYFGEHDLIGKPGANFTKRPLPIYEELGHLPLLIRHPQGLGAGKTIAGLGQAPDLFATALDLAGIAPVPWAQGHSLVPRLRGEPSPQTFAVGGCHPHKKGRVGCLSVWTQEWCLIYSPMTGLRGSELYYVPTDPTHTQNVIAAHSAIAQQLYQSLLDWLSDLQVSPARQRQLLTNAPFSLWDQLKYKFWLRQTSRQYRQDFGAY